MEYNAIQTYIRNIFWKVYGDGYKLLTKLYERLSGRNMSNYVPLFIFLPFKIIVKNFIRRFNKDFIKMKYEVSVFYFYKDSALYLLFQKRFREKGTSELIYKYASDYDVFIDVGSCWGLYTLLSGSALKIAIEPEQETFLLLQKNVQKNKIQDVILINKAISDYEGTQKLYLSHVIERHSLLEKVVLEEKCVGSVNVETTTIDNIMENYLNNSLFFKIDVEGVEAKVFQGMNNIFKTSNKLSIIFEYTPYRYSVKDLEIIWELVKGFDIFKIDDVDGTISQLSINELKKIKRMYNILLTNDEYLSNELKIVSKA